MILGDHNLGCSGQISFIQPLGRFAKAHLTDGLAIFPQSFPQQDGRRRVSVGDGFDTAENKMLNYRFRASFPGNFGLKSDVKLT